MRKAYFLLHFGVGICVGANIHPAAQNFRIGIGGFAYKIFVVRGHSKK
jgi:hypothetical protein